MSSLLPDGESSSSQRRFLTDAKQSLSLLEAQLRDKGTRFFDSDSVGLAASPLAHLAWSLRGGRQGGAALAQR